MNKSLNTFDGIKIQKAREILGEDFSTFSDDDLELIIADLYYLANVAFDSSSNTTESKF